MAVMAAAWNPFAAVVAGCGSYTPAMLPSHWKSALAMLVLLSVSGCGLKGPLYKPGEQERTEVPRGAPGAATGTATDPSGTRPEAAPANGAGAAESAKRRNTQPAPQSQKEDRVRASEPAESSTPTPPAPDMDRPAAVPPGAR